MEELVRSSDQASYNFRHKYMKHSRLNESEFSDNLKDFIDGLFNRNQKIVFTNLQEAKDILRELPNDYQSAIVKDDIYALVLGYVQGGREVFNSFLANIRLGRSDRMLMVQFTYDLKPIYYLIEYDGKRFHIIEDQTRDGYNDEAGYIEVYGEYLKFEDYLSNDGGITQYGYLTDNAALSYAKINQYYAEIEKDGTELAKPSFWSFCYSELTKEELNQRVLVSETQSDDFRRKYSGFADLHPSFLASNPIMDYDGDGILDRVYREYIELENGKSLINAYLFFGDGKTVSLERGIWGEYFSTQMVDLTGDGVKDICFIQYDNSTADSDYEISILQYRNGNYIPMRLPFEHFSYISVEARGDQYILACQKEDADGNKRSFELSYDGEWKEKDA